MQIVIAIIALFGATGTIISLSFLEVAGIIRIPVIIAVVLIAVYGMARIQPKEQPRKNDEPVKSRHTGENRCPVFL